MTKNKANIHTALLQVMGDVGYVQKQGKMVFGATKYNYAGESDLIAALRPSLIKAGITFYCLSSKGINCDDVVTEKYDKYQKQTVVQLNHRHCAEYVFRFTHAESGTYIDACAIGDGLDAGDKAAYKAATGALKYALRQTFIIETGDDPDKVSSESQGGTPTRTATSIKKELAEIFDEAKELKNSDELNALWVENGKFLNGLKETSLDHYEGAKDQFATIKSLIEQLEIR